MKSDNSVMVKGYKDGILLDHPYDLSEEVDRAIGEK